VSRSLQYIRPFDPWRQGSLCTCPFKYTVNPYTGCAHGCLYCYASSYIRNFFNPRPKKDFLKVAARDLSKIPPGSIINISSSSDPYQPLEAELKLTRALLEAIPGGYVVEVVTKSDLVARDADLLSRKASVVSLTVTTMDESLAARLEPRAPKPSRRIGTMETLSKAGVPVVLRLDPIVPGLNDDAESIRAVVEEAAQAGTRHVVTSVYKVKPDNVARVLSAFPDLEAKLRKLYWVEGERIHGYLYASRAYRVRVLKEVMKAAREHGLTFATCREGLLSPDPGVACDGTHLAAAGVTRAASSARKAASRASFRTR